MVPLIRHIIPRYRVLFSWEIMNTNALVRLLVLQFVQGLVFIVSLSITVSALKMVNLILKNVYFVAILVRNMTCSEERTNFTAHCLENDMQYCDSVLILHSRREKMSMIADN